MLYIEIIKVMDLDVLPNAQCTQFHGKWAEKDRNFGVTLMIEPVFMRATREGVKIMVVVFALGIKKIKFRLRLKGITDPDEQKKKIKTYFIIDAVIFIILLMIYVLDHLK